MDDLTSAFIYQYLNRITSEAETVMAAYRQAVRLDKCDTVDLIDYIESRVRYETATAIEKDIIDIMSWGRHQTPPN